VQPDTQPDTQPGNQPDNRSAPIGVIGGSGFYSLLDDPQQYDVETPYGNPSGPVSMGRLAGVEVAFLPRHGADHRFAPHRVPYRANLWALREVGARQVIALSAVGSLRAELGVGALVLPDQIVDRTWGRPHTFYNAGDGVHHIAFADPYCPTGRAAARQAAAEADLPLTPDGTLVVINGPRFSTRAESLEYQRSGWSLIGMTAMPEAALARELALCYTGLALVTDHDAGVEAGEGVTHAEVLERFAENIPRLRALLEATLPKLPGDQGDCPCAAGLAEAPPRERP
jgi:5'-methylthioadenosine phosphorylase